MGVKDVCTRAYLYVCIVHTYVASSTVIMASTYGAVALNAYTPFKHI